MSNALILLQYLILMLAIYIPMMRFRMFRRIAGFHDVRAGVDRGNGPDFARKMVHVIAKAGKDRAIESDGVMKFQCTTGMRLVTAALLVLLNVQFILLGFGGVIDVLSFLIVAGLSAYFSYYTWVFRIEFLDSEVAWVDWLLRDRSHDLSQLRSVEQDSSGGYRLEFIDGQSAYLFRYVEGHGLLKDYLLAALEINARTARV